MRFLFFVNLNKKNARSYTLCAAKTLIKAGAECYITESSYDDSLSELKTVKEDEAVFFDAIIAVGGDGTIMSAAEVAAKADKPILGINAGRVGFLSGVDADDPKKLLKLLDGSFVQRRRMLIQVEFNDKKVIAVNDAVISKPNLSTIIDLSISCNGRPALSYRADAVLFSTPTGSTAYALSNGGAVADPELDFISVSPICPHSLISRPYLFSDKAILKVTLGKNNVGHLIVDGRPIVSLNATDEVIISKSSAELKLLTLEDYKFFEVVKQKFLTDVEWERRQ